LLRGRPDRDVLEAGIQSKTVVADIGAGSGIITEGLVNEVHKIIAIDQSEKMLEIMQEKFSNYNNIDLFDGAKSRFLNRGKKRRSVLTLRIPQA